jgi:hypothetical protein
VIRIESLAGRSCPFKELTLERLTMTSEEKSILKIFVETISNLVIGKRCGRTTPLMTMRNCTYCRQMPKNDLRLK